MRHQNDSSPVPLFQNFLRVFLISASLAAGQEIKTILLQDLDQRGTVVFNIERGGLVQLPPGAAAARSAAELLRTLPSRRPASRRQPGGLPTIPPSGS